MDYIDKIISYENGTLGDTDTLELFSELIKTGQCWTLQGHYGRTAASLIDDDLIKLDGTIQWNTYNELLEDKNENK